MNVIITVRIIIIISVSYFSHYSRKTASSRPSIGLSSKWKIESHFMFYFSLSFLLCSTHSKPGGWTLIMVLIGLLGKIKKIPVPV